MRFALATLVTTVLFGGADAAVFKATCQVRPNDGESPYVKLVFKQSNTDRMDQSEPVLVRPHFERCPANKLHSITIYNDDAPDGGMCQGTPYKTLPQNMRTDETGALNKKWFEFNSEYITLLYGAN